MLGHARDAPGLGGGLVLTGFSNTWPSRRLEQKRDKWGISGVHRPMLTNEQGVCTRKSDGSRPQLREGQMAPRASPSEAAQSNQI